MISWEQVGSYSGFIAPLLMAALAWFNRSLVAKLFVPKLVLVQRTSGLEQMVRSLAMTNDALRAQAEGWRGVAQSAEYARKESEDLRQRVTALEAREVAHIGEERILRAKLQDAISHIQALYGFIAVNKVGTPPPLPDSLKDAGT